MKSLQIARISFAAMALVLSSAFAQEDPEAVYRKFHAASLAADFEEMRKYGTAAGAAEIAAMPAVQRYAIMKMLAAMLPQSYSITGKEVSADGSQATLRAISTGKAPGARGTITLLKEGGAWKVEQAKWGD